DANHPGAGRSVRRSRPADPVPLAGAQEGPLAPGGAAVVSVRVEQFPRAAWTRASAPRTIGLGGIGLGILALWLALPPFGVRTAPAPVAVGILGAAAGIWAISRREARIGWIAVVLSVVGIAGALLAMRATSSNLEGVFVWSALIAATLRYATPLTFAAIGGMFSERSGVVNIGLEGMMLMGAFFGVWGADKTGSWELGIVIAVVSGTMLALVHAYFAIHLRADQIVIGTAINFLALGISGALAALGGAYLTLGFIHNFDQNITGGRGFIALAALIFGKWRPFGAFAAALLFGFSSALGDRLPSYFAAGSSVPQLFNVLP